MSKFMFLTILHILCIFTTQIVAGGGGGSKSCRHGQCPPATVRVVTHANNVVEIRHHHGDVPVHHVVEVRNDVDDFEQDAPVVEESECTGANCPVVQIGNEQFQYHNHPRPVARRVVQVVKPQQATECTGANCPVVQVGNEHMQIHNHLPPVRGVVQVGQPQQAQTKPYNIRLSSGEVHRMLGGTPIAQPAAAASNPQPRVTCVRGTCVPVHRHNGQAVVLERVDGTGRAHTHTDQFGRKYIMHS